MLDRTAAYPADRIGDHGRVLTCCSLVSQFRQCLEPKGKGRLFCLTKYCPGAPDLVARARVAPGFTQERLFQLRRLLPGKDEFAAESNNSN